MNFTQEPWFTNLPPQTQQELLAKNMNANDIAKVKGIYSPKPPSKVRPMNALDKLAFNPLTAMAKAGSQGGNLANVMGAGAAATAKEVTKLPTTAFKPFFDCFSKNYYGAAGQLFSLYALGHYVLAQKKTEIDLNDPAFIQGGPALINDSFSQYIPTLSKTLWTKGLYKNFVMGIASLARDTLFSVTDTIQGWLNTQTFNILNPSIKQMASAHPFTHSDIINAISTHPDDLKELGGTINDNILQFNMEQLAASLPQLKKKLIKQELQIRDQCASQIKDNVMDTIKTESKTQAIFNKILHTEELKTNPALNTLNNQTKRTLTPISQNMTPEQQKQYDAAQADIGTGLGGLGTTGEGEKYKFDQLMNQAGQQFGLNSDQLSKMGFGPQEDNESPAVKMGIPKEQQGEFDKWIQQKMKDEWYKKYPQSQPSDAWNSLFQ